MVEFNWSRVDEEEQEQEEEQTTEEVEEEEERGITEEWAQKTRSLVSKEPKKSCNPGVPTTVGRMLYQTCQK